MQVNTAADASGLDRDRLASWQRLVIACCFATLLLDGMDVSAPQVAASTILKSWGTSQGALAGALAAWGLSVDPLGLVFGASNLGILIGMLVLAAVGDGFGRKVGIVSGVLLYSLPGCATPIAAGPDQLILIRFMTGLGIGGVLPNVIAMIVETVPRRVRAGTVLCVLAGYAVGGIFSGVLAAAMIRTAGWMVVFVVPALFGIVLAVVLCLFMPESFSFLTLRKPHSPKLAALVRRYCVDRRATADHALARPASAPFRIPELFGGALGTVTPLLWFGYFAIAATFLAILSWHVLILEKLGLTGPQAAIGFSLTSLSAVMLQLGIARILDRWGLGVSALTAAASCAAMIALAQFQDVGAAAKLAMAMVAVGCASVTMHLYSTAAGLFYSTGIRVRAVGWTTGVGRLGAVVGPLTAGHFIAQGMGPGALLYLIAIPYAVIIPICLALGHFYRRDVRSENSCNALL